MMYYIWKNNIKSDYIIITSHDTDFSFIDFDELEKGKILVNNQWCEGKNKFDVLTEDFNDNIKNYFRGKNSPKKQKNRHK